MSPKLLNILLIIASGVIYIYGITPLLSGEETPFWTPESGIQNLNESIKKYNATIVGVDGIISKAKNFKKDYDTINEDLKLKNNMEVMVPDSINEIKLLSELSNIASESGFSIDGLTTRDKGDSYSIIFTTETSYTKFKTFIENYDKNMRLLTLKSASFSPQKDENALIKFSVEMITYYLK